MDVRGLITGSVGQGAPNNVTDVRVVQRLLNDFLAKNGKSRLAINGVAGLETMQAISEFQQANGAVPNGRVDAGSTIITALVTQHLFKVIDLIDLSAVARYLSYSGPIPNEVIDDPQMEQPIRDYLSAFRNSA